MSSPMQEKFQVFEDEIRQRETSPARPTSLRARLLATSALLLAGFLLYRLPGSVPPPAWVVLLRLARMHALFPLAAHLALVGRSLALFVAYILWLYAAWRVLLLFRRPDPRLLLSQSPAAQMRPAERGTGRAARDEQGGPALEQPVYQEVEMRSAAPQAALLAYSDGGQARLPEATRLSVCLHTLVIQTSSLEKSRPAPPAVVLGPGESSLVAREGIGLAVASCCHAGRGKQVDALEDASLSAVGMSGWEDTTARVLPIGLFLVADGGIVGSEQGRYSTSRLAVQLLGQALLPLLLAGWPPDDAIVGRGLADSIQQANATLYQRAVATGVVEGEVDTGFTAALILGTTAYIAHVGNSRTYYYHPGDELIQLTVDHARSAGGAAQDSPGAAWAVPAGGQLCRSLGSAHPVEVALRTISLAAGDILLLCSDGFWERVERPLLEQTLQWFASAPTADPFRLCSVLQERALERGSVDHLSITAIQVMRLPACAEPGTRAPEGGVVGLENTASGAG